MLTFQNCVCSNVPSFYSKNKTFEFLSPQILAMKTNKWIKAIFYLACQIYLETRDLSLSYPQYLFVEQSKISVWPRPFSVIFDFLNSSRLYCVFAFKILRKIDRVLGHLILNGRYLLKNGRAVYLKFWEPTINTASFFMSCYESRQKFIVSTRFYFFKGTCKVLLQRNLFGWISIIPCSI